MARNTPDVYYKEVEGDEMSAGVQKSTQPFGSKNGTTYTYAWCGGSSRILEHNKIYFRDESHAEAQGRTLSKLCK